MGRSRFTRERRQVKREEILADECKGQLVGGINLDDRFGGGYFDIAIVVASG